MRIHHLNCGTMCPVGGRLVSGEGGLFSTTPIVCHCLLIEAGDSLVLVDTGMGTDDVREPRRRLGLPFVATIRPRPTIEETALAQVRGLGFDPADVRHVVATHLDLDHAGGLPDFPDAQVHLLTAERDSATDPRWRERPRYPACHLDHSPRWVTYDAGGDTWFGFESIRVLEGLDAEIALIPLPGHSRGHTGVAVRDGEGWLLHCGDAYFHRNEMANPASCPPILRGFQAMMAADNRARHANRARLAELARERGEDVSLFCAHDPVELARAQAAG